MIAINQLNQEINLKINLKSRIRVKKVQRILKIHHLNSFCGRFYNTETKWLNFFLEQCKEPLGALILACTILHKLERVTACADALKNPKKDYEKLLLEFVDHLDRITGVHDTEVHQLLQRPIPAIHKLNCLTLARNAKLRSLFYHHVLIISVSHLVWTK